eukprot:gene23888-62997_t
MRWLEAIAEGERDLLIPPSRVWAAAGHWDRPLGDISIRVDCIRITDIVTDTDLAARSQADRCSRAEESEATARQKLLDLEEELMRLRLAHGGTYGALATREVDGRSVTIQESSEKGTLVHPDMTYDAYTRAVHKRLERSNMGHVDSNVCIHAYVRMGEVLLDLGKAAFDRHHYDWSFYFNCSYKRKAMKKDAGSALERCEQLLQSPFRSLREVWTKHAAAREGQSPRKQRSVIEAEGQRVTWLPAKPCLVQFGNGDPVAACELALVPWRKGPADRWRTLSLHVVPPEVAPLAESCLFGYDAILQFGLVVDGRAASWRTGDTRPTKHGILELAHVSRD